MANNRTILLVIFPRKGHINPSLEFAKRLVHEGTKVNLVTGYSILNRMSKTTTPPDGLTFTGFSHGYDDGCKLNVSVDKVVNDLKSRGSKAVKEIIMSSIEKGQPFLHVVYTPFINWVGHVANALEIPSTLLMIQPATILDIYYHYFNGYGDAMRNSENDPNWVIDFVGLPRLVSRDLPSFVVASNPHSFAIPSLQDHFDLLNTGKKPKVLVNTFDELEFEALRAVENLNLVLIGPLVKDPLDTSVIVDMFDKSQDYMEWLTSKQKGSVIYVSFGSYSDLPKRQMEEIAKGLAKSTHRPFLWVIRKGGKDGEKYKEINKVICAEGFKNLGLIIEWCSQVEVLSHSSLGCFVTHCGWNSCLETLVCGVPIVGFSLWIDQGTNAKLMVDVWDVGLRAEMNQDGFVEGNEIKRCVEIVMENGEKGEELRDNAQKWKKLVNEAAKSGGSSNVNLKSFVNEIGGL